MQPAVTCLIKAIAIPVKIVTCLVKFTVSHILHIADRSAHCLISLRRIAYRTHLFVLCLP